MAAGVVVAIGWLLLAAAAFALTRDPEQPPYVNRWAAVAGVSIIYFLAVAALATPALAHDFWINNSGYRSPVDGSHCCGNNDCRSFKEGEVKATPSGYRLPSGEVVPLSEAQVGEDGYYWRCKRYDGTRRCFFTPAGGT